MFSLAVAFAQETGEAAAQTGQQSPFGSMLPLIAVMGAIMYFFMIRPNQKKEKERREMLAAIHKGDRVMTSGGMFGTIIGIKEKTIVLRIGEDPGIKVEFLRGAVSNIIRDDDEDKVQEKG